jgi:recombination protein RecT
MNQIARRPALDPSEVRATVVKLVPEFARALPPGVDPNRFARVVQTALQQNQKLLECTPDSLWGACMKAAQDGLLPDGREGAMVPRWNGKAKRLEAHWMPMVAGLIAKAKRKGSVASLSAQVVYEGEPFQVLLGDEDRIHHVRDIAKVKRGAEVAVYAIATMKDGSKEREIMSWEQVQQVAAVSADRESGDVQPVWKTWPEEMARKSCIRRLSKRLPSLDDADDDFKRAVERVDELYEFGKPAVAAPAVQPAIEHRQTVQTHVPEPEPGPVMNRLSHAELDEATGGDQIPDFEAPPPQPKAEKDRPAMWVASQIRKLRDAMNQDDYNEVMGQDAMKETIEILQRDRPELYRDFDMVRQETLDRIAEAYADVPA